MTTPVAACKHQIYLIGEHGHTIAFSSYPEVDVQSIYAIIKVSLSDEPITSTLDGVSYRQAAIVTRPAHTQLRYHGGRGIAFVIYPRHPLYRAINAIPAPGVVPLNRRFFQRFDPQLQALFAGSMPLAEAREVFAAICKLVGEVLPTPPSLAPCVAKAMECLHTDFTCSTQQLADIAAVAPRDLAQLFLRDMGVEIANYKIALQLGKAALHYRPGIPIPDYAKAIGFADEAQFAAAFQYAHGVPANYFEQMSEIHA